MADPTTTPTSSSPRSTPGSTRTSGPVTVRLPGPLRRLVDGSAELAVAARTVGAAVDEVVERHPALRRHLRTETGTLREHVNLFLNDDDVRYLAGEETALRDGDVLTIVPSIAGG